MSSWLPSYPPAPRSPAYDGSARYYGDRERDPATNAYPAADGPWPDRERDRERDWLEYDRPPRSDWEWRRNGAPRGRSRSPGDDGRRSKRRRSPSPYDRERYESRPRYDDYGDYRSSQGYDDRGRSAYGSQQSRGSRLADPYDLDYPANFRYFQDWFRATHPDLVAEDEALAKDGDKDADEKPRGMKARYEKYKRTMTANQIQTLFNHHRLSSWFGERYDPSPEFVKLRARVRKQGWQGREAKFIADLEEGKYDTLAAIATDSGAVHTGPEDDLSAQAAEENQDGEEQEEHTMDQDNANENEAANADAEANGSAPATGGDASRPRAGDISVMPEGNQVMIRTIPPDIGRLKLEEACSTVPGFVHLALGDPMQKRNYYRAGWIKFDDDANMSEAVRLLGEKKIEGFKLHVTHSTRPFISRLRSTPEIASRPDRVEKDLANVKKLAAILEDEALILNRKDENSSIETEGEEAKPPHVEHTELPKERGSEAVERRLERLVAELQEQHHEGEENGLTVKKSVIALDLYLAYLRYAFNCCYYCAAVTDHVEELQRKCIKHVRKPLSGADSSKDERWVDWLDQKIALLIDKNGVDPRDYGGKNYDEELAKAVEPHVKQEDEGKFRCKTCNKLFKATTFVEKHIANKHPELVKQLDDLPFFNNFALDPHRIQPFIHPPPPSGGGQHPPPQAYGLHGSSRNADSYPRHANQYPSSYAPHYSGYGQSSYYDHSYPGYGQAYGYPPHNSYYERRRSPPRRLAERMGDLSAPVSDPMHSQLTIRAGIEGLPAKPVSNAILEPGPGGRRGGRGPGGSSLTAGPLPPPPDAKEDPRAAAGRKISYHDMDEVAEGDIELTY